MMGQETEVRRQKTEDGPVAGDFESLKQAAKDRIARGDMAGLNPHKVLRLCAEFEQLKKGGPAELSEISVIDCEQATAPVPETGELSEGTRARVIRSLTRLVTDARHRSDDCRNNLEDGSEGGYSPELTEAGELLAELEKGTVADKDDRHHDENTLTAAYQKGFEDAKKVILQEVQKLGK